MAVPRNWVDALLQTMDEALFLLDASGTIVRANAAAERLTARDARDLEGRGIADVVRGVDAALHQVMAEGAAKRVDLAVTTPDGHRVPIEAGFTRLPMDEDQDEPLVLCVARDASLIKHLQNELRAARGAALSAARQRTMFLATMSHELRTPLNGVIGMAGLLRDTALAPEQQQMVETINNSGAALLDLVDDILDFTRVDAGQVELEIVTFDLRSLLDSLMDGHAPAAHGKGLDLVAAVDSRLPPLVLGDPSRLRQVLNNLLGNAIKFTEHGYVALTVQQVRVDDIDTSLHFEVLDSGIGISENARESLFRPFVQADPSTARRHGGSGLGLAVARRLVRLMGGELDVESAPREGARFAFDLVLRRVEGDVATVVPAPALDGARVLVATDCAPRRGALVRTLEAWGAQAQWSAAEETLGALHAAAAEDNPFQAVIVDTRISDGDPLALPLRIADGGLPTSATVIVAVPVGAVPQPDELADAGVALTITKPIRSTQLEQALRLALRPSEAIDTPKEAVSEFPRLRAEGMRVLVAEDNLINQKVALGYLRAMGIEADAVSNGREAVDAVNRIDYTLVLMDVHMPQMDGLAATIRIRRGDKTSHIPIIGLTADVRPEARARCEAAGMEAFVAKPVTPRKLAEALREWIPWAEPHDAEDRTPGSSGPAPTAGHGVLDLGALRRLRALERAGTQGDLVDGLVRMFLERTPVRIERMARALSAGQHGFVELEAHSLKSSCRNLGADRMASCAAALELAAADASPAEDLVVRLGREFSIVATLLRRL